MSTALVALSMPPKWWWYLTRGGGAVALVLLTASFVLGVATSVGAGSRLLPRFVVQALHRNLSLLITVFVVIHVVASVADGYVALSWLDGLVPMLAGYRRIWTGLGTLAFAVMMAILVTSLLRVRLGLRAWRAVHLTSYACWPIALVHTLGTGSDVQHGWMLALCGACTVVVAASVVWRLLVRRPVDHRVLRGAVGATVLVPALVGVWLRLGPLQDDWGFSGSSAAAAVASPLDDIVPGVTDTLRGTLTPATTAGGRVTMQLDATLDAHAGLAVAVEIRGQRGVNGVAVESGTVTITDGYDELAGALASDPGGRIASVLTGPDGRRVSILVRIVLDARGGPVTATLTASEATS